MRVPGILPVLCFLMFKNFSVGCLCGILPCRFFFPCLVEIFFSSTLIGFFPNLVFFAVLFFEYFFFLSKLYGAFFFFMSYHKLCGGAPSLTVK